MVEIHIKEYEIKKYLYFIVVFNALFPKVLEESNMVIYITDSEDENHMYCMSYNSFIHYYDQYGLNQVAK